MTGHSRDIRRVGAQQDAIGWRQLFNGRFSEEWSRLQDDYYATSATRQHDKRLTGAKWQATIIGVIWEHWDVLWEQQNQAVHGMDASTKSIAIRVEVDRTLSDLYRMKELLDEPVQRLMRSSEAEHRREPLLTTRYWISVHGQLIRDNLRTVQAQAKSGMQSIRSYFPGGG